MGFPEPGRLNYSNRTPQQNYGYRPQTYPNQTYPNRAPTYVNPTYANPSYSARPQNYGNQIYSNPGANYGYTGRSNYGYTGYGYRGPQNYAARPSSAYSNSYRAPPAPDYSREIFESLALGTSGNTVSQERTLRRIPPLQWRPAKVLQQPARAVVLLQGSEKLWRRTPELRRRPHERTQNEPLQRRRRTPALSPSTARQTSALLRLSALARKIIQVKSFNRFKSVSGAGWPSTRHIATIWPL